MRNLGIDVLEPETRVTGYGEDATANRCSDDAKSIFELKMRLNEREWCSYLSSSLCILYAKGDPRGIKDTSLQQPCHIQTRNKWVMAHQEHARMASPSRCSFYSNTILHQFRLPRIYAACMSSSTLHSPRHTLTLRGEPQLPSAISALSFAAMCWIIL